MAKRKKINLLFDATIIVNAYDKKQSNRSGIFFVALNILKQLCSYKDITIYLYSQNPKLRARWPEIKSLYFQETDAEGLLPYLPGFFDKINYKIIKSKEKFKYFSSKNKVLKCIHLKTKILLLSMLYQLSKAIVRTDNYANIDAFLSPIFKVPDIICNHKKIKKYVILYDLIPCIFPEKYKGYLAEGTWLSELLKSLNSEDAYFSISECTKKDFLNYCPELTADNVIVTLLGHDKSFQASCKKAIAAVKKKYNIPQKKKYVFSLCNLDERKNLIRAVKTFVDFCGKNQIKDMVFVLGGAKVQTFIDSFEQAFSEIKDFKNKIIRAGYVDDEDLAPLYSGAEWFVYTSQYEGFGLPPLEAMACGCPVITSNNSSLPEVVGDAGIMIDWDSDKQHVKAYEKYYFEKDYRKMMAEKGLKRAKQFSWEKCVKIMVNKIRQDLLNVQKN